MDSDIEELVKKVEATRKRRKPALLLSILLIVALTLVLIWTVEPPQKLLDVSPYVFLSFIAFLYAVIFIYESAKRNELLLLETLKRGNQ